MLKCAYEFGSLDALKSVGLASADDLVRMLPQLYSPHAGVEDSHKERTPKWGPPSSVDGGDAGTRHVELGLPTYGGV